jgi:hypothetical protein
MATSDVIAELVRDLRPVRPLPVPRVRVAQWVAVAAARAAAVVVGLGVRPDLSTAAVTVAFQAHVVFLMAAAAGSAAAALSLAVPGERQPRWLRATPIAATLAWGGWLAAELMTHAAAGGGVWPISPGWGCVAKAFAVAIVPGGALAAMVVRAAPLDWRAPVALAALAGTAVGALGVEVTCPLDNPMHLLLWHAAPVLVTVLAAMSVCWAVMTVAERMGLRR